MKLNLILFGLTFVSIIAFSVVSATDNPTTSRNSDSKDDSASTGQQLPAAKSERFEKIQTIQKKAKDALETRCDKVEGKVKNRVTNFDAKKSAHIKAYQNTKNRVTKFTKRAKAKGFDTAKLEEDLKTLDAKIKEFAALYSDYIEKLKTTQTHTCGKSQGLFAENLQDSKDALKLVHAKAKEIREFIHTTIKEDLKLLKEQIVVSGSASTGSVTTGNQLEDSITSGHSIK